MAEIDLPFLEKKALESDMLVFFDFEATEYTHRAIEIGVAVFRKEPGQLALGEEKALYRKIIYCDDPVGPRVERLSGLTAEIVRQEGIPFSEVVKNIIDLCRDNGLSMIYLTVNKQNLSSIAVYEKLGFVRARELVTEIGNGFVMDDYVMEKYL